MFKFAEEDYAWNLNWREQNMEKQDSGKAGWCDDSFF